MRFTSASAQAIREESSASSLASTMAAHAVPALAAAQALASAARRSGAELCAISRTTVWGSGGEPHVAHARTSGAAKTRRAGTGGTRQSIG